MALPLNVDANDYPDQPDNLSSDPIAPNENSFEILAEENAFERQHSQDVNKIVRRTYLEQEDAKHGNISPTNVTINITNVKEQMKKTNTLGTNQSPTQASPPHQEPTFNQPTSDEKGAKPSPPLSPKYSSQHLHALNELKHLVQAPGGISTEITQKHEVNSAGAVEGYEDYENNNNHE